ncbi:MAG: NUDIX hydrolase [Candidatus Kapaibacteriota bacterium]
MKLNLETFLRSLQSVLKLSKLKGIDAQIKMSPMIDNVPYRPLTPVGTPKPSSVLLLLIGMDLDSLNILLTLRSSNVQHHKRQISFPGGHCEKGEDYVATALREVREEIGLNTDEIRVIGMLSPLYVPPSETLVYPIVAHIARIDILRINYDEVEEVIFQPLYYFLDASKRTTEKWLWEGKQIDVPMWKIHNDVPLWGATAMIMSEFVEIVKDIMYQGDYEQE